MANDASEMMQQNKYCNEDDLEEELSGNDDIEGQIELVIEQMNDSNDASQHTERQAESLVEDVGVDDSLIEEYNTWYQLEQKEFEIGCYQIEIERLRQKISDLELENFNLKTRLQAIQQQSSSLILAVQQIELKRNVFGAAVIKNNDHNTIFYTGLLYRRLAYM